MSTSTSIHTFTEGMDKDTSLQYRSKTSYYDAENLRFVANRDSNTGTLYNIKGTSLEVEIYNLINNPTIVGTCAIGDYIVIFLHDNTYDYIYRYDISTSSLYKLYQTTHLLSITGLGFSRGYVDIIGREESDTVVKIYWTIPDFPLRTANIAEYLTDTGLVTGTYLPINRFDIVTGVNLYSPSFNEITSGQLNSGKVQYAYSLYKPRYQETTISSLSLPIPLYTSTSTDTRFIIGDEIVQNTGKGISINISYSTADASYFEYITLYRIHYTVYNQLPIITIVGNYKLKQSAILTTIIDVGGIGLGTLTIEEFSLLTRNNFTAKTLESKDNRMFVANIEDTFYDVDFDARTYRFNNYGYTYIADDYSGTNTISLTLSTLENVVEDHNCVNIENNIPIGVASKTYYQVYQSNGSILGGEGPNIKYTFALNSLIIDDTLTYFSDKYGGVSTNGYTNTESSSTYVGYQRGEVYRCGIVFYNNKGQASPVKWMGDIRFPSSGDPAGIYQDVVTDVLGTNKLEANVLGLSITFKSGTMPSTAVGWQLVRVPRTETDRSILMTGVMFPTLQYRYSTSYDVTHNSYVKKGIPSYKEYTTGFQCGDVINGLVSSNTVFSFVSPDMFYSNIKLKAGDRIVAQGLTGGNTNNYNSPLGVSVPTYFDQHCKYHGIYFSNSALPISTIDTVEYTTTSNPTTEYSTLGDSTYLTYNHMSWFNWAYDSASSYNTLSEAGTCYTIKLSSTRALPTLSGNFDLPYVNIYRTNLSRYGGYTYEDRENNSYISCGSIIPSTTLTSSFYGGDTYISYFAYTNSIYTELINGAALTASARGACNIAFPVESIINNDLSHDEHYFRTKKANPWLIRENSKDVEITAETNTYTYTPSTNLYQYNTVYSTEQNVNYNIGIDTSNIERVYPSRVLYSDKKINNEEKDSWCIFRSTNYLDLDYKFGPINKLKKYDNIVYFWQDKAFGMLPINQRALVEGVNIGQLQMGVSGILDYYQYITENYGMKYIKDITKGSKGLYWYDSLNKAIIRYNKESVDNISLRYKMNSYIKDLGISTLGTLGYDKQYNEVLFKVGTNKTLVFNEIIDKFTGFFLYHPEMYVENDYGLYYLLRRYEPNTDTYRVSICLGDNGVYYNRFDPNTGTSLDSTLLITDSDNFLYTKAYDNIRFYTEGFTYADYFDNTSTFSKVNLGNSFQYTGSIDLVLNTNVEKREREYVFAVPRNIVLGSGTTNIDILDTDNQDSTRLFKERLRDKFITSTFTKTAPTTKFGVFYVNFEYRISKR